jgi:hypothetical protein
VMVAMAMLFLGNTELACSVIPIRPDPFRTVWEAFKR